MNPLVLRKKLQVLDSLPIVYHHAGFGVYGEIIVPAFPTHYDAVSPLICPLWRCCSARFFSEEFVPCIAVGLVCLWEDVSLGSSYVPVLNQSKLFFMAGDGERKRDLHIYFKIKSWKTSKVNPSYRSYQEKNFKLWSVLWTSIFYNCSLRSPFCLRLLNGISVFHFTTIFWGSQQEARLIASAHGVSLLRKTFLMK